jgi:methionine-rich copper-binding protein CopC
MIKRSLLLATAVLLAWPAIAAAHPAYKDSDPKANATIAQPPSEVWVEFTETIEDGTVSVFDPCGEQVDNGDSQQNLTNDRITVTMSANHAGAYRVVWKVIGSDSHPTNGQFNFTSSGGDPCPGAEEEEPTDDPKPDREPKPRAPSTDDGGQEQLSTNDSQSGSGSTRGGRSGDAATDGDKNTKMTADRQVEGTADRASDITAPTADRSVWDGLPLGDFFVALGISALIGAAGGRIYAGIMGPAGPEGTDHRSENL